MKALKGGLFNILIFAQVIWYEDVMPDIDNIGHMISFYK